jgi:uncharacterized delta-60 repeat protein
VALQADGKIIIGGYNALARLNSDGSRDACFNPAAANGNVSSLLVQPDGRVLLGGSFSTVNGIPRNGIARINADASLDGGFDPGTGVQGLVSSMVLQPDGKVIIGGDFYSVNGVVRPYIARLYGNSSGPQVRAFRTDTNSVIVAWPGNSSGLTLQQTTNLASPNWVNISAAPSTVGSENQVTLTAPAGQRFFRLSGPAPVTQPSPIPGPAAPTLAATAGNARVVLNWNTFAGASGHRVQRSTSYYEGPYTTIAQPGTNTYTDLTAVNGTTYYYRVSVIYPCGESAYSSPYGIVPQAPPPTMHVQSITMSWVASGSRYQTKAVVRVVDNNGAPVSGATVTGNFTGAINNAGRTGVSNASGDATVTSSSSIRNGSVTFTVWDIYRATMNYNAGGNVINSATISR